MHETLSAETIRQTNSGICEFDFSERPWFYSWNTKNAGVTNSNMFMFNMHGYASFQSKNASELTRSLQSSISMRSTGHRATDKVLSDRQILGFANLIPMSGHGFTRGMPRTHGLQIQICSYSTCMDTPPFNLRMLLNWQDLCKVQYQWDQQGIELRIKCSVAQTSSTISLKWLRILPGVGSYAPPDAWSWI